MNYDNAGLTISTRHLRRILHKIKSSRNELNFQIPSLLNYKFKTFKEIKSICRTIGLSDYQTVGLSDYSYGPLFVYVLCLLSIHGKCVKNISSHLIELLVNYESSLSDLIVCFYRDDL